VVEPLILIVCFWAGVAGAAVVTGAAGAVAWVVATALTDAVVGTGVTVVFVPLSRQPATSIDTISRAARLKVRNTNERFCVFIVFTKIMNQH
jgi:hypothetical protein